MSLAIFIRWATREIKALWQRLEKIDVQQRMPTPEPYLWVVIDQGNELEDGSDGILYEASVPSVPSAYDPDATTSFIDGIGRGTLYRNGVAQAGYVLVVNSDDGTFRNALVTSDVVWVGGPIAMSVDGGGTVSVYTVM